MTCGLGVRVACVYSVCGLNINQRRVRKVRRVREGEDGEGGEGGG